MRARPDIQTAVSFFTTRVKEPDKDDWGKLRHCLMYLKGTLHMKRHLSAENLTNILWWVDGSYGVQWDSKGQTGAMMTMGKGALVNISRNHKLNVGSSTEAELVSIADVLGMMMWCKYFMEAQGYTIDTNVLYQDNKSTILLAKNGRMSAGKNSKHIHHRFFLITDKIAKKDLEVKYAPTKQMWADINTKPLQGTLFREMRANMMGIDVNYDDEKEWRATHPKLLPKVQPPGVLSSQDVEVLRKATGIPREAPSKKSIELKSVPTAQRRSVLDSMKHGPKGPVWALGGIRRLPSLARLVTAGGGILGR